MFDAARRRSASAERPGGLATCVQHNCNRTVCTEEGWGVTVVGCARAVAHDWSAEGCDAGCKGVRDSNAGDPGGGARGRRAGGRMAQGSARRAAEEGKVVDAAAARGAPGARARPGRGRGACGWRVTEGGGWRRSAATAAGSGAGQLGLVGGGGDAAEGVSSQGQVGGTYAGPIDYCHAGPAAPRSTPRHTLGVAGRPRGRGHLP